MSIRMYFGTGDPEEVARLGRQAGDRWRDAVEDTEQADFSLHLEPADLDLLSLAVGDVVGVDPQPLRPALTVLVDGAGGGVLLASPRWVGYIAAAHAADPREVTEAWEAALSDRHGAGSTRLDKDAEDAVRELVELCFHSHHIGAHVLHWWWP